MENASGLFPLGELNYPDWPIHTSYHHKMDPNESKDKEPEFLVPLTHPTPLGLKEMCGNLSWVFKERNIVQSQTHHTTWEMGSQLEQSLQSNRKISMLKDRAFELLSEWEKELPPGCFNFIMESLGRKNRMLLSHGRYEDMPHQIEQTYNSSVSNSRPVLIRNPNVILPVKERLKGVMGDRSNSDG
ncbi:hypothetical protein PROFUN_12774 [Planoprotostelium fungivorum]|uniref:Uncharacterized protein n=1 Tax=Planoprotostelium fungivorum TaxID=1890364 RepID=A0A2P6N6F7_9EUKA|nr:hypothetical protein PROFUN_12774 [Planoprotostelium fungivorum]